MANSQSEKVHYLIAVPDLFDGVTHRYAASQQDAIEGYIDGDNPYGYNRSAFEGYAIYIAATKDVTPWYVREKTPEPNYALTKGKRGNL
jgi:hypothetical protein